MLLQVVASEESVDPEKMSVPPLRSLEQLGLKWPGEWKPEELSPKRERKI